jgi:hypothetical protein
MSMLRPLLAQELTPTDVLSGSRHWMGLTVKELVAVLGAVALVTLLLFLWAVYVRKKPHRHSHHHHHHSPDPEEASASSIDSDSEVSGERRYRRKRRRRREHRPRNPTLAETGGLPPLRTEHPPDPLP